MYLRRAIPRENKGLDLHCCYRFSLSSSFQPRVSSLAIRDQSGNAEETNSERRFEHVGGSLSLRCGDVYVESKVAGCINEISSAVLYS